MDLLDTILITFKHLKRGRFLSRLFEKQITCFIKLVSLLPVYGFFLQTDSFKLFYGCFGNLQPFYSYIKLSLFEGYSVGFMDYYYQQLYSLQRRKC